MFPLPVFKRPYKLFSRNSAGNPQKAMDDVNGTPRKTSQLHTSTGYAVGDDQESYELRKFNESHSLRNKKDGRAREEEVDDVRLIDKDIDLPDGGLQAWLVVFGSFMGLVPVFGMINSLGAIESYISKHQLASDSSSVVSWIFSIYLSISFLSCIYAGGYFDRNGSTTPMYVGTLFYVGGLMATANCTSVWQFILAFSILCGTGTGVLTTPLVSCVATWFLKKRAMATSVATIGGSIGGIVFPVLLRKLYAEVGFQWALRIVGFICLCCLVCATVFAKERQKPVAEPFKSKPEAMKWYLTSSFNWRYFLDWKFFFAALGVAFAENSLTASATFISSYSMARGNSETSSYALITTTNAVGILGRYIPGYLADRFIGRFNTVIITISLAAFFNLVMWLPFGGNIKVLWAYASLYGFSTGSILSLTPVCIGQISSTHDFGKRYSTAYLLQAIMTVPVIPVGGAIIGEGKVSDYNNFIIYTSMMMIAGSICYIISRFLCVGFKFCKF